MFPTEFCGLWLKIENIIFCTRMYSIIKILRRERARSDVWTYEITISNKLDRLNLIKPYIGIKYHNTYVATYVIPTKHLNLDPQLTIYAPLPSGIFGICNRLFLTEGIMLSNYQATVGSGSKQFP